MKLKFFLFLLAFPLLISAALPTAYIQWQQPIYNVDGAYFAPEEISHFTIHYGLSPGAYTYEQTIPPNTREAYIPIPYPGKWYIAATVTSIYSETSGYSNEVLRTIADGFPKKIKPPSLRFVGMKK